VPAHDMGDAQCRLCAPHRRPGPGPRIGRVADDTVSWGPQTIRPMARLFPEHVPRSWREDQGLRAERRVFRALSERLSDDYSVLWRVPLYDEKARRQRDAEADFVILHPSIGLLALEVKGGAIGRDGSQWFSIDQSGTRHEIKDPYAQAARVKHILVAQLRELPRFRSRRLACAHGVVLPDAGSPTASSLGPNAPRAITAFADDLGKIDSFVEILLRLAKDDGTGLGAQGLREAEAAFAPRFRLPHPLQASLEADDAELLELTEQQFNVLDLIGREPRVLVTGGAGTGKTLLALELIRRLTARGLRTLLTTASPELAGWLSSLAEPAPAALCIASLGTIDAVLLDVARSSGRVGASDVRRLERERFGKAMVERWLWITDEFPDLKFDAIVIDEAQDLLEEHWTALSLCLNDPNEGAMYAFCDEAQLDETVEVVNLPAQPPFRLSPLQDRLPSRFVEITLVENLRNTQKIFELARPLYVIPGGGAGDYRCKGPVGQAVHFIEANGWEATRDALTALLRHLVVDERIPDKDVAVLYFPGSRGKSVPWYDPAAPPAEASQVAADVHGLSSLPGNAQTSRLAVVPASKFRGMERPAVVIVGGPTGHREAYIGLTRPRVYLALIGGPDDLDNWRPQLAASGMPSAERSPRGRSVAAP
jgi:hypothetical protein